MSARRREANPRRSGKPDLGPLDFLRAAGQRLAAAEFLHAKGAMHIDAYYLAGYTVECALKALILARTPTSRRRAIFQEIRRGATMHSAETLSRLLEEIGSPIPTRLTRGLRLYPWATDTRYRTGRGDPEQTAQFLVVAGEVLEWVKENLR